MPIHVPGLRTSPDEGEEDILLVAAKLMELLPPSPEQKLPNPRPEIEDSEPPYAQEQSSLHCLHLPDLPLLEAVPEAHQNQKAEHRVLEVVHGPHRRLGASSPEPVQQDVQDPPACSGIGPDAGWVQDLRGQVAAEDPPRGAVEGGAD
ncbi:hypothetical protein CRG98_041872, partial [Punica granatum]